MAGKGTRHRFELSRLEIAGVIVSATAGLFVVFLLGVYAGRGMGERKPDGGEQIVRLPVAPAVEQTPGAEEGLTFYDTLGNDERVARGEAAEGRETRKPARETAEPAPLAAPPEEPPAVKPPDVAVHAEKAAKPEPPLQEAPVREAPPPAKHEPEPVRQAAAPAPSPVAPSKNEHASPAPPSTARVAVALAPAVVPTPRAPVKGDWSVQVSATRDPRTADTVLRRLRSKGYDAFVLKVRRRGETFYRVRVGHYASLDEAQHVVSRLRREPGVPEAFVASD